MSENDTVYNLTFFFSKSIFTIAGCIRGSNHGTSNITLRSRVPGFQRG